MATTSGECIEWIQKYCERNALMDGHDRVDTIYLATNISAALCLHRIHAELLPAVLVELQAIRAAVEDIAQSQG